MKYFILATIVSLFALATTSFGLDGYLSGEYKMYGHDGARTFEGELNVGQKMFRIEQNPYVPFSANIRPFVNLKYNADNVNQSRQLQHAAAEYKGGVSATFNSLEFQTGVGFNQNLNPSTFDDRFFFVKSIYSFGN